MIQKTVYRAWSNTPGNTKLRSSRKNANMVRIPSFKVIRSNRLRTRESFSSSNRLKLRTTSINNSWKLFPMWCVGVEVAAENNKRSQLFFARFGTSSKGSWKARKGSNERDVPFRILSQLKLFGCLVFLLSLFRVKVSPWKVILDNLLQKKQKILWII